MFLKHRHNRAGAEPGVNPRRDGTAIRYGHFQEECIIDVVDYSSSHATFKRVTNEELIKVIHGEDWETAMPKKGTECRKGEGERVGVDSSEGEDLNVGGEETGKVLADKRQPSVRWINIGGLDWQVLSAVSLRYNFHSLALEDVLHEQGHNHSKADYYHEHLFLRILCHCLSGDQRSKTFQGLEPPSRADISHYTRDRLREDLESSSGSCPDNGREECTTSPDEGEARTKSLTNGYGFRFPYWNSKRPACCLEPADIKYEARLQQLRKISALNGDRVDVRHEPMFIFLFRDGTVISIHPSPDLELTQPIEERLHQADSVLRTSADASILVESLLDLVVDRVLEVIDEYQNNIHELEQEIMSKSNMSTVRCLHILSGDLIMHKRTLEPIRSMIDGLRRYDAERYAALGDNMKHELRLEGSTRAKGGTKLAKKPAYLGEPSDGYFSHKAKVYLADVYDHIEFALISVDMFTGISENLINYAFNVRHLSFSS
ncbi:hypothetical protein AX17_000600 [Amanita inopinata Kibby_2008]|nr:hypothetical protein AX17_000600 [Amanita inopinata Kibby_2008]